MAESLLPSEDKKQLLIGVVGQIDFRNLDGRSIEHPLPFSLRVVNVCGGMSVKKLKENVKQRRFHFLFRSRKKIYSLDRIDLVLVSPDTPKVYIGGVSKKPRTKIYASRPGSKDIVAGVEELLNQIPQEKLQEWLARMDS